MADYNIEADITANTKGYEAGIKKAQESTKKFSTSLSKVIQGLGKNGLVGAMGSIGLASAGLSATLGAVVKIAKRVSQAIGECTEAYKKQNIAEISLKTAMQNNPLTNGQGTKQLREFASEMQRTSNMGDEEIIPFMTQLIASGRTEAETMKIIKTASDMASSGAMSFDTAITQLNATLNGNIGRLGQQNAELKGLTEEELKNGKAVDILAEKYKGLTEATLDTKKKLTNAIGDLKESFGSVFEKALSPMRNFFAEIIQGWADARKAKQEYEGAVQAVASGNADIEQLQIVIDANQKKLEDFNKVVEQKAKEYKKDREEILANWIMYLTSEEMEKYSAGDLFGPKQAEEIERQNYLLNGRIRLMEKIAESEEKVKQKRKEGEEAEAQRLEREQKAIELKDEYLKKIAEQESKWQHIKEVTGEDVDNEEKIKFYQDALVELMTKSGGLITTENDLYKEQIAIIQKLQAELQPEEKKTSNEWIEKIREQAIERLKAEKETYEQTVDLENTTALERYLVRKDYNEKIYALEKEQLMAERERALKSVEGTANEYEEKARIIEYYNNEFEQLGKKYSLVMEKEGEQAGIKFAEGFAVVVKGIQKVLDRATKIIKSMVTTAKSMFTKMFDFDISTALDKLLVFEDKVLTFFVETLPQLPAYFDSALQSVAVLLENVLQIVTPERIAGIITDIMKIVADYGPQIIGMIADVVTNMIDGIINSLPQILETMNVLAEKLAEVLPQLVQKIIDLFIGILKQPEKVAQFVVTLIKMFVEIFNVLIKNIGPLLEALLPAIAQIIWEIIKALPDILVSTAKSMGEGIKGVGKAIGGFFKDLFTGKLFANGTPSAPKGLAIVGEAGPELVNFRGGEQVLSNRNTQKALAGIGNSGNTFNVTFNNTMDTTAYAMMSQLKQYNRELAINGVI